MQYNDTSTKTGLLQAFEFWTRQSDGSVTGDATQKAIATVRLNAAFEKIMPLLLAFNDQVRWDDLNHTDAPIGYVNIVANQNDYKITEDDNSLDILNITKVRIKTSSSATAYTELERISADDPRVAEILSPDTTITGTPSSFLEMGNTLYLDILPSYAATSGIELFFGREQYYFTTSDTTKEPGIPKPFHELLALYAAFDWNIVNRTADTSLLTVLRERIEKTVKDLDMFIRLRYPTRAILTPKPIQFM